MFSDFFCCFTLLSYGYLFLKVVIIHINHNVNEKHEGIWRNM